MNSTELRIKIIQKYKIILISAIIFALASAMHTGYLINILLKDPENHLTVWSFSGIYILLEFVIINIFSAREAIKREYYELNDKNSKITNFCIINAIYSIIYVIFVFVNGMQPGIVGCIIGIVLSIGIYFIFCTIYDYFMFRFNRFFELFINMGDLEKEQISYNNIVNEYNRIVHEFNEMNEAINYIGQYHDDGNYQENIYYEKPDDKDIGYKNKWVGFWFMKSKYCDSYIKKCPERISIYNSNSSKLKSNMNKMKMELNKKSKMTNELMKHVRTAENLGEKFSLGKKDTIKKLTEEYDNIRKKESKKFLGLFTLPGNEPIRSLKLIEFDDIGDQ